jgi:hypothetical protein
VEIEKVGWKATAIAASGIVALGALAGAIGQEHTATAMVGIMSIGQTSTASTAPTTPATSVASPTMKATKPKGF